MAARFMKGGLQLAARKSHLFRAAAVVSTVTTMSGLRYRQDTARCESALAPPEMSLKIQTLEAPQMDGRSVVGRLKDNMSEGTRKVRSFLRYLYRFLTISTLSAPMTILGPAAYLAGENAPIFEEMAINYCVWAMETLGPAFVKLGQWASARPDLYSPRIIEKLRGLQDNVRTSHTLATVEGTLTDSFGPDWRDVLTLDPKPIGAGKSKSMSKTKSKVEGSISLYWWYRVSCGVLH